MRRTTILLALFLLAPTALAPVKADPLRLDGLDDSGSMYLPPVKWSYFNNPVEHDDIGRSAEPDGWTWPGGNRERDGNCVLHRDARDVKLGCKPAWELPRGYEERPITAGCTDEQGRQPSGLCGLYTVGAGSTIPPRTIGMRGVPGAGAPNPYNPTKAEEVAFFDFRFLHQAANVAPVELNRKIEDLAVENALAGLVPDAKSDTVLGSGVYWAWWGRWTDKNGNGVIDESRVLDPNEPTFAAEFPANEFVWFSTNCYPWGPFTTVGCEPLPAYTRNPLVWTWPSKPSSWCGGSAAGVPATCLLVPGSFPGKRLVCAVDEGGFDGGLPTECDPWTGGDELLDGPQSQALWRPADLRLSDWAANADAMKRTWRADAGFPAWHYDDSVIQEYWTIARAGRYGDATGRGFGQNFATDVDHYRSWAPAVGDLLVGTVKPATRDAAKPVVAAVAACAHAYCGAGHGIEMTGVRLGGLDSFLVQTADSKLVGGAYTLTSATPSHEPNAPGDLYAGRGHVSCGAGYPRTMWTHEGRCNDYSPYQGSRRLFADVRPTLLAGTWAAAPLTTTGTAAEGALPVPMGGAVGVPQGPHGSAEAASRLRVLSELGLYGGDYGKTGFGPGSQILFTASVGWWADLTQRIEEAYLDPATLSLDTLGVTSLGYAVEPDRWIGSLIEKTEAYESKGYHNGPSGYASCEFAGVERQVPDVYCDPYLGGAIEDPNDYDDAWGKSREWEGECPSWAKLRVTPVGGVWSDPVFVVREYRSDWEAGEYNPEKFVKDFTNLAGPIDIYFECTDWIRGKLEARDLLVFPIGLRSHDIETELVLNEWHCSLDAYGGSSCYPDQVRDRDRYYATDLTIEIPDVEL